MNKLLLELMEDWQYMLNYHLIRLEDEIPRMTYSQAKVELENLCRIIPSNYDYNFVSLNKLIEENFQYDQQYQIDKIARTYYINI